MENYIKLKRNKSDTKTNKKFEKNAIRPREPNSSHWTRQVRKRRHYHRQWSGSNSWPIRCHRTWTRELAAPPVPMAVRCPSTCMLEVEDHQLSISDASDTMNLWNNRVNIYDKLSLIAQDIHSCCACKSGVCWKGFFSLCRLLTAGRRNRLNKSLLMWACLKLNKILANTGINASVWTLEL